MDFSIKNSVPGSTKKDRAIVDPAILNPMPFLNASPVKCTGDIGQTLRSINISFPLIFLLSYN